MVRAVPELVVWLLGANFRMGGCCNGDSRGRYRMSEVLDFEVSEGVVFVSEIDRDKGYARVSHFLVSNGDEFEEMCEHYFMRISSGDKVVDNLHKQCLRSAI